MFVKFRFALLLSLAALLGCGSSSAPTTPASSYLNLNGNWMALATPNTPGVLGTPIADFTGALESSSGTVTGTLRAFDPVYPNPCVPSTQDLYATGTLSATGQLVLAVPISGGTATITATLGSNLNTFMNGSWQIVGGSCAMPLTPMAISQFAPVMGTYAGTLNVLDYSTIPATPVPGTATAVTAVLTQSATPNADGMFPLDGTVTATGACSASVSVTGALISGGEISESLTDSPLICSIADPTAASLLATFSTYPSCGFQIYQGTLTRR